MSFNSFQFWLVYPCLFLAYWLIPERKGKLRKWYLIAVSYLLYMNWLPAFALVLLGVSLITYVGGTYIERIRGKKYYMLRGWLLALLALLPLLIFKYYNFVNANLSSLMASLGLQMSLPGLNWAVPIGISFFTFQAVGYYFDVFYSRIRAEHSLGDYLLFVSFFPQIMSGPISKASELLPQIKSPHPFCRPQGVKGLRLLLWGMFLKLVIADRLGLYVDAVYSNFVHYSGWNCLLASVFYSLQIYTDFAGYSLMAMGIAKTLGFDIINNFHRPYFAVSVTDFWHRWHISLSRWLKDYVYIPLGGSRCSKARNYLNILLTFLVSGIWHGAAWTFILWGVLHGIAQVIEKFFHGQRYDGKRLVIKGVKIAGTFVIINFLWIVFRMPNVSDSVAFVGHIFSNFHQGEFLTQQMTSIKLGLPLLILKDVHDEFFPNRFRVMDSKVLRRTIYLVLFSMIILNGVLDSGSFIYVSF